MNYVSQLNAFFDIKLSNPLSANAQCLYINLFYMNNKCSWIERFTVSNTMLCALTGIDRRTLDRVRNELIQKGYIEYKKGIGNQAGTYLIVQFDTQDVTQTVIQDVTQNGTQMSHKLSTLNKHKLNKKENILKENWQIQFDQFWKLYPRKVKKSLAQKWFEKKKPDSELFDSIMASLKKYRESPQWTKDNGKFIPHPSTWLNQERWEDEIEEVKEQKTNAIFYDGAIQIL